MAPVDPVDPSESGSGFSAFLQAVASAPPPDRAFAPGAVVRDQVRISRPLFESGDVRIYLAVGPQGDVALVRQPALAPEEHRHRIEAWASDDLDGRVRVAWSDTVADDVVLCCVPVPVGTLRSWLEAGPHAWREVVMRLGPVASALLRSHVAGVSGFCIDADGLWLGLDGRVRLAPPVPGRGDRMAEDRAQLRALVRAAVGPEVQLPRDLVGDRESDANPTVSLARALGRTRPRLWPWAVAAVAVLSAAAWLGRPVPKAEPTPVVAPPRPPQDRDARDRWKHALMRVDAGDPSAHARVDALGQDMPGHVALLRARLADDAGGWTREVERASAVHADDARLLAETRLEQADVALHRGALLEAHRRLAEARSHAARTTHAPVLGLQRLHWELETRSRDADLDIPAIRTAFSRASAPSLQRVAVQHVLAQALEARGRHREALEQHGALLAEPRADMARLRLRTHLARAHLFVVLGKATDADRELEAAERDVSTDGERAATHLGRAAVARRRGDRDAAMAALERASGALEGAPARIQHVDLGFERGAWLLHGGRFGGARAELSAALALHDSLCGVDARSRLPLEDAYRRALEDNAGLMTSSPPSHASASP